MIKKSTYTRAYEACEAFFAETGQMRHPLMPSNPSLASIARQRYPAPLKPGKMTCLKLSKKIRGVLPGIPVGLTETVNALWQYALTEARQVFNEKYAELQAQQTDLTAKETVLNDETARIQQLLQLTEQKFQEEIAYLKKESERLTEDSRLLTEQAERYRALATEVEKENAVLKETIKQEQDKVQRLEIHYDKEHDWAVMRIEEEKDSHRQQTQQEMLRLQAETTRSKQTVDLVQAKFDMMSRQQDVNRDRINELERSLSDEKLKMAKLTSYIQLISAIANKRKKEDQLI